MIILVVSAADQSGIVNRTLYKKGVDQNKMLIIWIIIHAN